MGGETVQDFPSGLCCSGYGTLEMVGGGGGPIFLAVFSVLSAFLAGGRLW